MPPWKAVRGFRQEVPARPVDVGGGHRHAGRMGRGGCPLGRPARCSRLRFRFQKGGSWARPTWCCEIPESFRCLPTGTDIYRCFVLPTDLPRDTYISAIEYRPDNRRVVHHMLGWVDTTGRGRKKDAADPGPGYSCFSGPEVKYHSDFGGWSVGRDPARLPDGVGYALPKGADVILQIHYHPDGKPETDRSKIGLHFARTPIKQTVHRPFAFNAGLLLLPGKSNIEVKASWTVPVDLVALAVTPHMHKIGRDMAMTVTYPDGHTDDADQDRRLGLRLAEHVLFRASRSTCPRGRSSRSWPTTTTRRITPTTPTSRPGSSPGARRPPTRCASALSPSPRRART